MHRKEQAASLKRIILLSVSVVLSLVLIFAVLTAMLYGILEYHTSQTSLSYTRMMRTNCEQILGEARNLLDQMVLSQPLGKLMYYQEPDAVDVLAGLHQLNAYRRSSTYVDSIYLYNAANSTFYVSSDHAMPQAVQPKDSMFDRGAAEIVEHVEEYANLLPFLRTQQMTYPHSEQVSYVTLVRYNALEHGERNLYMVNILQDAFFSIARSWEQSGNDLLTFLSQDGSILFSSPDSALSSDAIRQITSLPADIGTFRSDRQSFLTYDRTFPGNWIFAYQRAIEPIENVLATSNGLGRILFLSLLVFLMLVMLFLLIRRLIYLIHSHARQEQMLAEEVLRTRNARRQEEILRALYGTGEIKESVSCIAMLILFQPSLAIGSAFPDELRKHLAHSLSDDEAELLFDLMDTSGNYVLCFHGLDPDMLPDQIRILADEMSRRGDDPFACALSDEFSYPSELQEAYELCSESLQYRALSPHQVLFLPEEIRLREANSVFTMESMNQMTAAIQKLDAIAAEMELDRCIHLLCLGTLRHCQLGLMQMTLTISEVLSGIRRQYKLPEKHSETEFPQSDAGPASVRESLLQMIRQTIEDVKELHSAHCDELAYEVDAMIEKRYQDPEFTVNEIAEHMSLTPAYLSRQYRKITGNGLSEKITEVRIQRACSILNQEDIPVSSVAAATGFSDTHYFYRVFKKITGVTPGNYRQSRQDMEMKGSENRETGK